MTDKKIRELFDELEKYDTPSITDVVATYPANKKLCMGLYEPWSQHWYCDQTMKCMTPELGPKAGYAVTVVFGLPDPNFDRLTFEDLFKAIEASPKPAMIVIKQDFPEEMKSRVGLAGGNMVTAFKALGAVGLVTDGPSRDLDEIQGLDFQYMLTGLSAGHGLFAVKAVNVPVSICGMDVAPGEIVHSDVNGVCKFPADRLEEAVQMLKELHVVEETRMGKLSKCKTAQEVWDVFTGKK